MAERIRELLEQDVQPKEIARRLGVSASTVSRHARRLGFTGKTVATRFDWAAIRAYYNDGNGFAAWRARFGSSNGAWDAAVSRGDVVPRGEHDSARASLEQE